MISRPCIVIFVGAMASCVARPAQPPPAGAAGFVVEPTAASRGEPFVTSDGWTVQFERLVLSAGVARGSGFGSYADVSKRRPTLWDGALRVEIFIPSLPVERLPIGLALYPRYSADNDYDRPMAVGVSPSDEARFVRRADDSWPDFDQFPTIAFAIHAEKAGRVVTMDLALHDTPPTGIIGSGHIPRDDSGISGGVEVDVRADDIVFVPLSLDATKLLKRVVPTPDEKALDVAFDPFARADADSDGRISVDELRSAESPSYVGTDASVYGGFTLLDDLRLRCAALLKP